MTTKSYEAMLSLAAEFVIDESLRKGEIKRTREAVELALQNNDKVSFDFNVNKLKKLEDMGN